MSIIYRDTWIRPGRYELEHDCIHPVHWETEWTEYRPLDSETLLLDFLQLGWLAQRGKCSPRDVLQFTHAYGQLGFLTAVIQYEYDNGDVKLHRNNFVSDKKALTAKEYFTLFLPQNKPYNFRKKMPVTMRLTGNDMKNQWFVLDDEQYCERWSG